MELHEDGYSDSLDAGCGFPLPLDPRYATGYTKLRENTRFTDCLINLAAALADEEQD